MLTWAWAHSASQVLQLHYSKLPKLIAALPPSDGEGFGGGHSGASNGAITPTPVPAAQSRSPVSASYATSSAPPCPWKTTPLAVDSTPPGTGDACVTAQRGARATGAR